MRSEFCLDVQLFPINEMDISAVNVESLLIVTLTQAAAQCILLGMPS
jgi:hypothetical protein